ncbi:hypothetical protein DL96DRAFT_1757333 [Flagelloscypha sp. PMI_526]|nr:hypothetical protein DL96DRAFT_1757333 [Flagelloscypha sp. PMI_526]
MTFYVLGEPHLLELSHGSRSPATASSVPVQGFFYPSSQRITRSSLVKPEMRAALALELFSDILSRLDTDDLKACSYVCSSFRDITERLLFSHISVGSWDPMRPQSSLEFYTHDARGKILGQNARKLTVHVGRVEPENVNHVSQLLWTLKNKIRILNLIFYQADRKTAISRRIMEHLSRYIFPWIVQLSIDVLEDPGPSEVLSQCPHLRTFIVVTRDKLPLEADKEMGPWPHLNYLYLWYHGQKYLSKNQPPKWLLHAQTTIQSLYLGRPPDDLSERYLSLLPGFTALRFLKLGMSIYYFITDASSSSKRLPDLIPFSQLTYLQRLTFMIPSPRHQTWPAFFFWIEQKLVLGSPSLKEVQFELEHPLIHPSNMNAIYTAQHGVQSRMPLWVHFNQLAFTAQIRLKFVLVPSYLNWDLDGPSEEEKRCGFELLASVLKRWFFAWHDEGKLEIFRRW